MTNERGIERRISQWLEGEAMGPRSDRVLNATFAHTRTSKQYVDWRGRLGGGLGRRPFVAGLGAALVIVLVAALGLNMLSNRPGIGGPSHSPSTPPPPTSSPSTPQSTPPVPWSPVRTNANEMPIVPMGGETFPGDRATWRDQVDTTPEFIDITDVSWLREGQMHWGIHLSGTPPAARTVDPEAQVIEYGLVFDTDTDGVPDYEVGINNSPGGGRYRVWVTDLKSNTTEMRNGPPYGFPVEFSHPDEVSDHNSPGGATTMTFTFLGDTKPPDLNSASRLYAWASYKEHGSVVAWDYAPDFGWLGAETAPTDGPTPSASVSDVKGWPDTGENAPGDYSWGGRPRCAGSCNFGFMHNGYGSGDVSIEIAEVPAGTGADNGGAAVTVAGHNAIYRRIDAEQEEWLVDLGETSVSIRVTSRPGTSESDLAEAHAIVDSIRYQATSPGQFRLIFTLATDVWDSG